MCNFHVQCPYYLWMTPSLIVLFVESEEFGKKHSKKSDLTVGPGEDAQLETTWIFFIVLSVGGGQGE